MFESTVQQGLMAECGACHQLQGAADSPFLAAPDLYISVTTYPGVVVPNANQSVLVTRPADPGHGGGQAPNMSDALRAVVLPWLTLEASRIPPSDSSTQFVTPFKPKLMGALNTVYLGDLDPTLENVSITFNAYELGQPPSMLVLENLEVHPIADMSLRVVHPLFTMYPDEGGDPVPDPADSFSGLDDLFEVTGRRKLGTGTLVHTAWQKDAYLGMAFVLRHREMIRITAVPSWLGPRVRKLMDAFSLIVIVAFSVMAVYYASSVVADSIRIGRRQPTMLEMPNWISELPVVIGFALLAVQGCAELVRLPFRPAPEFSPGGTGEPAVEEESRP